MLATEAMRHGIKPRIHIYIPRTHIAAQRTTLACTTIQISRCKIFRLFHTPHYNAFRAPCQLKKNRQLTKYAATPARPYFKT